MNFKHPQTLAALNKLPDESLKSWLRGMRTVYIDLRVRFNWIDETTNFTHYLNCAIWAAACSQLFGIPVDLSRKYFVQKGFGIYVPAIHAELIRMMEAAGRGGGNLFILFDEVGILEGETYECLFPQPSSPLQGESARISFIKRHLSLMEISREWMNCFACVLSIGKSKMIHEVTTVPGLPFPCIRSPVFLKPFNKEIIMQIMKTTKMNEGNPVISEHFGIATPTMDPIASSAAIGAFAEWLENLTVGLPRLLLDSLTFLGRNLLNSSAGNSLDYHSLETVTKRIMSMNFSNIPLNIMENEDDLEFLQLVSLQLPLDLEFTKIGNSRKNVQYFVEQYQLVFTPVGEDKVKIAFPWFWWEMIRNDTKLFEKLGEFRFSDITILDRGSAFEHFVIYRLQLTSRFFWQRTFIANFFPFLRGTEVGAVILQEPFDIIYSNSRAVASNLKAWTREMLDRCCKTQSPKIYVPAPQSSTPDVILFFPRGKLLPPLVVGIQCRNFSGDSVIYSPIINSEMEKFSRLLEQIKAANLDPDVVEEVCGTFIMMTTADSYGNYVIPNLGTLHNPGKILAMLPSSPSALNPPPQIMVPPNMNLLLSSQDQMRAIFGESNLTNLRLINSGAPKY